MLAIYAHGHYKSAPFTAATQTELQRAIRAQAPQNTRPPLAQSRFMCLTVEPRHPKSATPLTQHALKIHSNSGTTMFHLRQDLANRVMRRVHARHRESEQINQRANILNGQKRTIMLGRIVTQHSDKLLTEFIQFI